MTTARRAGRRDRHTGVPARRRGAALGILTAGVSAFCCTSRGPIGRADTGRDISPDAEAVRADGGGGEAPDAAADLNFDHAPSQAVWSDDASRVIAEILARGFGPPPPAQSECQGTGSYTLTVADRKLAWRYCQTSPDFTTPWKWTEGQRTLAASELDLMIAALRKVHTATAVGCGADKSTLDLRITTPAGEQVYLDNFYNCGAKAGIYVDDIDGVFAVARMLAK
jgi:hypothetical protein